MSVRDDDPAADGVPPVEAPRRPSPPRGRDVVESLRGDDDGRELPSQHRDARPEGDPLRMLR